MSLLSTVKNQLPGGLARDAWVTDNRMRGEKVAQFRRYVDGDFDASMTREMQEMLRVSSAAASSARITVTRWCRRWPTACA